MRMSTRIHRLVTVVAMAMTVVMTGRVVRFLVVTVTMAMIVAVILQKIWVEIQHLLQ